MTKFRDRAIAELEEYGASVRTISAVENRFGHYISDLQGITLEELKSLPGFGQASAKEITLALRRMAKDG